MKLALLVGVALGLSACHSTVTSGGIVVYENYWNKAVNELRYQASIDLNCPPERVEFTLAGKQGTLPTLVHAAGCGQQALYGRLLRHGGMRGRATDRNTIWERRAGGPVAGGAEWQ